MGKKVWIMGISEINYLHYLAAIGDKYFFVKTKVQNDIKNMYNDFVFGIEFVFGINKTKK